MTISEYFENENSLCEEFTDIEKIGGYEIFDNYIKTFYSIHRVIADTTKIVKWKFGLIWNDNLHYFTKLYESMNFEYDPISNYDKHDTQYSIENERTLHSDITPTTTDTTINNYGVTTTTTYNTTYDTQDEKLTEKNIISPDNLSTTTTQTGKQGNTQTYHTKDENLSVDNPVKYDGYNEKLNGDKVLTSEGVTKGNIGVTSTQDLIEQERKIINIQFVKVVCERLISIVCVGVV
jgi:hypothetical protein